MTKRALFGPSGNCEAFTAAGFRHTYEEPAWIASIGLDAYEYSAGNGITGGEGVFRKIGEEAKKHGIALSFHTPYFISLSGVDPEKRLGSIGYIKDSIRCAEWMGADTIVIHCGSCAKISREEALALSVDTLYHALEECPDTKVHFGIETMGKQNQLGTLEEVLAICRTDARLYPVVDFGHLNARDCGGVFQMADDYARVFDAVATVLSPEKAETLHCHFSKIEYTNKGEKRHLTFADEQFGPAFEPLIECIVREGLAPRVICESAGTQGPDALTMKQTYEAYLR